MGAGDCSTERSIDQEFPSLAPHHLREKGCFVGAESLINGQCEFILADVRHTLFSASPTNWNGNWPGLIKEENQLHSEASKLTPIQDRPWGASLPWVPVGLVPGRRRNEADLERLRLGLSTRNRNSCPSFKSPSGQLPSSCNHASASRGSSWSTKKLESTPDTIPLISLESNRVPHTLESLMYLMGEASITPAAWSRAKSRETSAKRIS